LNPLRPASYPCRLFIRGEEPHAADYSRLQHRVAKRSWGAFATTDLERQLKARGVTQVVVTGVVTSGGVEATARQAYEQGFNVTLALDAMTDIREEAHQYSIANVFPRLGETGSAREIVALLERRISAS
jgi:nicotinamidase-related amidase